MAEAFGYLAYSPNGRYLLADLAVWDTVTQAVVLNLKLAGSVRPVFSPNNNVVVVSGFNPEIDPYPETCQSQPAGCNISLWSLQTGQRIAEYRGHHRQVHTFTLSPDGKLLTSSSADGPIRIRDVEMGLFQKFPN
jgi:WD40 repeat protein